MSYPEKQYHREETAKEYTKVYTLQPTDDVVLRQEDGMMGYISAGQFATTGSNELIGTQIISGSLQLSGSVYVNGHKQYNYGQFYDLNSQSGSSGSIQPMQIRTTDFE